MIGKVLGKYRLVAKIGEGGMGTVFEAEHTVLGSPAAVKILLPMWTQDAVVVDRFFHEAKAASAIRHSGIIEVFDFGRDNGEAWIAMELLRGETLTQMFERSGRVLDPSITQQLMMQVLGALDAAHATGVVHRDLKPDNLFLVRDPSAPGSFRVKILDFGIAKLGSDRFGEKMKTKGGTVLGTPAYMAPEQCKGVAEVDLRADLYAVGCILFELLTGRPPFVSPGGGELMAMHIYEQAPRLAQLAPQLPGEFDALIAKMLVKNVDERVPSAAYTLAALERVPVPTLRESFAVMDAHTRHRAATYAPPGMYTQVLPEPPPPPVPSRALPIAVIVIALAIAAAAVYFIAFTGDLSSGK